jgi:hypothetical protein
MPTDDISVGELSRQVQQALVRFEHLAARLDSAFVSKSLYDLYAQGTDKDIAEINSKLATLATKESLTFKAEKSVVENHDREIKSLKDNMQWVVRTVLTFVILAVLGAVFVVNGLQK